jgi:hypothetical protein
MLLYVWMNLMSQKKSFATALHNPFEPRRLRKSVQGSGPKINPRPHHSLLYLNFTFSLPYIGNLTVILLGYDWSVRIYINKAEFTRDLFAY